jgi:hypothetical protein
VYANKKKRKKKQQTNKHKTPLQISLPIAFVGEQELQCHCVVSPSCALHHVFGVHDVESKIVMLCLGVPDLTPSNRE